MAETESAYTNRLIEEKSPYLLQHAHNPVDWYPWGDEAFAKAKKEGKPIFLSIGYSTCHWCHVMEAESFSDPGIADIINTHFVAVKVDREERPDIDSLYMRAVLSMTGKGGWPLTVILTPEKKPFFGGTYFPPSDRWGMPGLSRVLLSIAKLWKEDREKILSSAEAITALLKEATQRREETRVPIAETFSKAYEYFKDNFDAQGGGFGPAPKFPTAHNFLFLLRYWDQKNNAHALSMVKKSLDEMGNGGIYDHLGGGFHRYATDAKWRIPHFEKMLYDQALLIRVYLEAYQATGERRYAAIAKETSDFVLREMTDKEGGFYSAFDADSLASKSASGKKEGAFYVWQKQEIVDALSDEDAEVFCYSFGVEANGNAASDPHGDFKNKNILYRAHSSEDASKQFSIPVDTVRAILQKQKAALFQLRAQRPKPYLDDKILADWNGLMIATLSFASRVLHEPRYKKAAERCARFITEELVDGGGKLLHRYRDGEADISGMLDDYAFFTNGLLDLYEATFDAAYLAEALEFAGRMVELFWDKEKGGFYLTAYDEEKLLFRQKKLYEGAIPSGNSVALLCLLRIGKLTAENRWYEYADLLLDTFSSDIDRVPFGYTQLLSALYLLYGTSEEIVIASAEGDEARVDDFARVIYSHFLPNKIVALRPEGDGLKNVVAMVPFIEQQAPIEKKTTVFVCENYACKAPVTEISALEKILRR